MRKVALFIAVAMCSCGSAEDAPEVSQTKQAVISHGATGGNAHFFFLPPMVPNPTYSGTFNAGLSPKVEICELSGSDCVTPLIAEYTMTSGPGSETISVSTADEQYHVNWHTDEFNLDTTKTYRVTVSVASTVLGFADVQPVETGKQLKKVDTNEYIGLVDGRTLPIKFRIEEGAVYVVGGAGGTITAMGGKVKLEIPAGALPSPIGLTISTSSTVPTEVGLIDGTMYDFGPAGTVFQNPIVISVARHIDPIGRFIFP